jgi:WD40 repeat protein
LNPFCAGAAALAVLAYAAGALPAQEPKQRTVLKGLKFDSDTLAISPDGKLLAAGGQYGRDGELKLWDLATGKERTEFKGSRQLPHITFSPDGKTLASGGVLLDDAGAKQLVRFYDPEGKKAVFELELDASVIGLAYSPDGKLLALGCGDNMVRVWDVEKKEVKFTLKGVHSELVQAVAFSPDGKTIASGGYDKLVCLWDAEKGKERATLKGHTDQVRGLAFSPDGKTLASAGWDKSVRLWDAASGEAKATLEHKDAVTGLAFTPDGKTLAAAVPFAERIVLWDVATAKEKASVKTEARPNRVAFTPDGKTLAAAMSGGTVIVWDYPGK